METLNIINQDNFILFLEDLKLEMSELIIEKSAKLDFTVFFKNVWFVVRIYKFSFNLFRENFIQPTKMITKTQNVCYFLGEFSLKFFGRVWCKNLPFLSVQNYLAKKAQRAPSILD